MWGSRGSVVNAEISSPSGKAARWIGREMDPLAFTSQRELEEALGADESDPVGANDLQAPAADAKAHMMAK
jgi:hypothetical protein